MNLREFILGKKAEPESGPSQPVQPSDIDQVYAAVCEHRRAIWAEHMTRMHINDWFRDWSVRMERKHHTPYVQVWFNVLPWLTALMVVRYGEAIDYWPLEFSTNDLERAQKWYSGKDPAGVTYLAEGEGGNN